MSLDYWPCIKTTDREGIFNLFLGDADLLEGNDAQEKQKMFSFRDISLQMKCFSFAEDYHFSFGGR